MTTVITRSSDDAQIEPDLVLPLTASGSTVETITHKILGRTYPDVTLREASAPAGSVDLFFLTYADAEAARAFHTAAATFSFSSDTMPWLPAAYVPTDTIARAQQTDNRKRWVITVPYQEIPT